MSDRVVYLSNAAAAARSGRLASVLARLGRGFAHAVESMATRRQLLDLDDRMLSDLGISRAQAEFEATRSPWRMATREDRRAR